MVWSGELIMYSPQHDMCGTFLMHVSCHTDMVALGIINTGSLHPPCFNPAISPCVHW